MTDLITLSSSVLEDSARVIGFRGVEAVSRPYEIDIYFTLPAADAEAFDMGDAIGARAVLSVDRGDPAIPPFRFAGILGSVELLQEVESRTLFRALLVPRLQQLTLSRHSRIFSRQPFPAVLEAVLQENGLSSDDYELRLGSYDVEEHICQYRESDFDFLSRWMEREGIYYFFEHGEHGEKVIFADTRSYEPDPLGAPVPYHPQSGDDASAGSCFRSFTCRYTNLPASVRLKDYDYAHPNLGVAGAAPVSPNGTGEISLYGERFFTPAAGERLARIRAEQLLAKQVVFHADGTRLHLHAGHTFDLEDHARGAFNTRYLSVEVHHHGNQGGQASAFGRRFAPLHDEVYFVEVTAIPATTQFRAESRAPWPRIYGHENGVVDGAADSEYAQIDEQGRYKVKLHFDESSLKGGGASTFVRMMQPHGGAVEGFHFPLRKGTEVLLTFLGGDPDRPVISGVAPNALTPSPVTSSNHTLNVIQTGGKNRIEMDDLVGGEQIYIVTPFASTAIVMGSPFLGHNLTLTTEGSTRFYGGDNWDIEYKGWKHERIHGMVEEDYHLGQSTFVHLGDRTTTVQNGSSIANMMDHFAVAAGGAVSFLVNRKPTGDGFWPVEEPGFHVCTDTDRIFLNAKASSIDLEAQKSITVHSKAGPQIRVDAEAGALYMHALNGVYIDTEQYLTARCSAGIDIVSDGEINIVGQASAVDVTMGNTMALTVGNSLSYTKGNSTEASVGDSVSLSMGNSFSASAGLSLDISASAAFALCAGLDMAVTGVSVAVNGIEFAESVIEADMGTIKVALKALHIIS